MKIRRVRQLLSLFFVPLIVGIGIVFYIYFYYYQKTPFIANLLILVTIFIGSFELLKDTVASLRKKQFALDYIAILAILVGLISQEYLVASIIVLMLSGGQTLEKYGMVQAKKSLTALANRIPNRVLLFENGTVGKETNIESITVGQQILVRKGEVIPLDGILLSEKAETDESTLTGEPYVVEKQEGEVLRSGTVNVSNPIVMSVTKSDRDSTYRKIVEMVQQAQQEKAPLIRIADQYSGIFTIITFIIAGCAFFISRGDIHRILAVLVIATPCPLILATPIALMGGVNLAAKKRIIVKRLASLEVMARVKAIIFDKTGTITLGKPALTDIRITDKHISEDEVLAIAWAIERNSLHPMAKAITHHAKQKNVKAMHASNVAEVLGKGISGEVNGKVYTISKGIEGQGIHVELWLGEKKLATIHFEDEVKMHAAYIFQKLKSLGLSLSVFTGDKKEETERVLSKLGISVMIKTDCTPKDKLVGIMKLKKLGMVTAMVGDGINDAPALARADIGMVFSHEEQTAASEASDVVFLGGDIEMVLDALFIARRTIYIAKESIVVGIGISIFGMVLAALGFILPIMGSFLQETIDILVIFNALRAARSSEHVI